MTLRRCLAGLALLPSLLFADPITGRIAAANLTCGRHPSYAAAADPEGAGARILQALAPDIVLIQEFNTDIPIDQWVADTFGDEFVYYCEDDADIPNGIVSRYPITESGEWDDPTQTTRDFAWARIELPNNRALWAISVHLYGQKSTVRVAEARQLIQLVAENIPPGDLVVLGGDFNTPAANSPSIGVLAESFVTGDPQPVDQAGDPDTNSKRSKPYDRVLPGHELAAMEVPIPVGEMEFPHGLVFDSRVFDPLPPPVRPDDSAVFQMQHMAVIRAFQIPAAPESSPRRSPLTRATRDTPRAATPGRPASSGPAIPSPRASALPSGSRRSPGA